ncbi:MAG: DNA repair protein RecO [Planctomycetota bacterium]
MKIRDRAVLLVSYPAAHSSCVLHLFTRDHGLIHLFARGFRRITGKQGFQGSGDPLTLGEVVFRPQSIESGADALGQLLAQEWTEDLRPPDEPGLAPLARRSLAAEAVDSLFGPAQVDTAVFELLAEYLDLSTAAVPVPPVPRAELQGPDTATATQQSTAGMADPSAATPTTQFRPSQPARPTRLLAHLLIRLLALAGHRPDLRRSVMTGTPLPPGRWDGLYSFERGGAILRSERDDPALVGPFWTLPSGIARVTDRFALVSLAEGLAMEFPSFADQPLLDFAIVLCEAAAERTFKSARPLRRRRSPFPLRQPAFAR